MKLNAGLVLGLLAAGTLLLPDGADARVSRGGAGFRDQTTQSHANSRTIAFN